MQAATLVGAGFCTPVGRAVNRENAVNQPIMRRAAELVRADENRLISHEHRRSKTALRERECDRQWFETVVIGAG